ncbi:MAG: two-component regulator propeller domain-containing protein [Cyclobacteriaceae bacterium]
MRTFKASFNLLLTIMFIGQVNAQSVLDTISFHHIKRGMSQASATQIFEVSEGFLWVGTPNGLNKFDGTNFEIYEKGTDAELGLTDGYVESIYEDGRGELYIGTNQGLNIYDRELNVVKPFPFLPSGSFLQSKYIGAIARNGSFLWLGTDNSGVYRYNLKTGETKQIIFNQISEDGPSNHYIVELFTIPDDKLLMITQASIYIINEDFQIISQITEPQDISRAIQVTESEYLLGTHQGEFITLKVDEDYAFTAKTISVTPGYAILSLATDEHQNVWLGSENGGLSIYSQSNLTVSTIKHDIGHPNSISSNSIWAIHKAKNGVMWLGPFKKGLSFYDKDYYKFRHVQTDPFNPLSLSNNLVNSFLEAENGNLWVGTDGGGLNFWNREKNIFEVYSLSNGKLHSDVVLSFLRDKNNKIWIGSWANGLAIFDPETKKFETWTKENSFLGSNNVTDILEDRKGRIWIVTLFGGVHVYLPESGEHQHVSVRSERDGTETITVARLYEDRKGQIWVGSQTSGLFRLEENRDSWVPVHYYSTNEKRVISNDFINTMYQDVNGDFWVGTQAGLNKYLPKSDAFEAITKKNGLVNDAIKGIEGDTNGHLWLSTGGGIAKYNPKNGNLIQYDEDDGLQGNEFNASSVFRTKANELVFGGSNGFNIFKPEAIVKRQDAPKVLVSSLRLFNKTVTPNDETGILSKDISQTDTLFLNYNQDVIDFEFQALTYRHPERVQYAYFLENFEPEWNYVEGDQHATYTNLSPGDYTLRIKSTNSDGVWVNNETSMVISITPPYWETWWFRTFVIVCIALAIFSSHRLRVLRLERYQIKLEKEIDARTHELKNKHKKLMAVADELSDKNEEIQRFAFAVSHDLKSPLNSIKGIASLMSIELNMTQSKDMQEYVQYIDETCDLMKDLITDITKIAKLGKIENKNEVLETNEMVDLASNLVHGRLLEHNAKLYVEEGLPQIYGDRNRVVQVFENLLDNAIKYMGDQKDPVVRVEAHKEDDVNQFRVIDNGSGMTPNQLEKLFTPFERFDGSVEGTGLGLYMVKKIIDSHDGTISAKSEGKGKGTTFIITFPSTKSNKISMVKSLT